MNLIEHIKNSFEKADKNQSKVNMDIHGITGLTGRKYQHLLNNLVRVPNCNYLEIGVNQGATLVAAMYGNSFENAYAIDTNINHNEKLENHKKTFAIEFDMSNDDCFEYDLSKIKKPINVYHYDGDHSYKSHYMALEYYYSVLADEFIYIVDDWLDKNSIYYTHWRIVQDATYAAIKKLNLEILYEESRPGSTPGFPQEGEMNYHQGVCVFLLKKN